MRVALIQSELVWGNVTENLLHFERKVMECRDVDLILLPEMFTCGSMMVKRPKEVVNTEKKAIADRYEEVKQVMQRWAKDRQAMLLGSTIYETAGNYYNRMIIAFPNGDLRYYDKRHCFRMGGENEHFEAGNERIVFEYLGVKIAPFICYDLRFPVWSRNVEEYDLALYIANWPAARRKVWQTLLKARAIENQAYVVGVNCVGMDLNGIAYAGDSMGIDARGEIILQAAEYRNETVVMDCDMKVLREFRRKFAVLEDRDAFVLNLS
jgi:predicted amidohydrolase